MESLSNSQKEIIDSTNINKSEKANPIQFNPFLPEFRTNPYLMYHRLRSENPINRSSFGGDWVVTRYQDVKTILRDRRVSSHDRPNSIAQKSKYLQNQGKNLNALAEASNKFLFYTNPPSHTRLRRLVSQAFSPIAIERMRPQIQTIVDGYLKKARNQGKIDIIADFAEPLPVQVIARMLGIPPNDARDRVHQWAQILSRILDSLVSLEEYEAMNKAIEEFQDYLRDLIAQREKDPQDDLISYLIAARDDNDKLSQYEVLSTCIVLFMAGEETTINTIGNGMLALLHHPEQMEKLKKEPEIIQMAVEEILRYDSPVQITSRLASETLEIGGHTIEKGERILLFLGAANRDPAQFPDPDRFDILRQENQHLAFGDGIHRCLGAALARLQAEIAIISLVQQLPNLELASDKLEWRKNMVLRGVRTCPVKFSV